MSGAKEKTMQPPKLADVKRTLPTAAHLRSSTVQGMWRVFDVSDALVGWVQFIQCSYVVSPAPCATIPCEPKPTA
jgi:hypothetical protein